MMASRGSGATSVLDQYVDALLHQTINPAVSATHELNLAQVARGYEMICLWHQPLNNAQALCIELMLLAHIQKLAQSRLRDLLWLSASRHHQYRSQNAG
ncbi:MAG: hypothetical protein ACI9PX_000521 [Reinekea sp.]|jgi:hypothetical protein